jgi:hypothetical protein
LATHIGQTEKEGISTFVKQKNKEFLSDKVLKQIDHLLDDVKVCDPAIGSGAFPMGLLQEIFMLKERIAFDLGFSVWRPATVKESIIQNSIYGVDIEKGAVDIAQLRFWLSLVVDEDKPKPLPNLAYKIVVGNSLVSKFGDEIIEIDWSTDTTKGGLFGQELITEKIELLKKISETQEKFFSANNKEKDKLKKKIRKLKLDILGNQLAYMLKTNANPIDKNSAKKQTKKQTEKWLDREGWKRAIKEINNLKKNDKPFEHFDWKLDFPEILNPLVNENSGFDIVIGNPPYGVSIKGDYRKSVLNTLNKVPDYEIYYFFIEKAHELVKNEGILSYIIPNTYLFNTFASSYRIDLFDKWSLTEILDCTKFSIFQTATVRNTINTWKKGVNNKVGYRKTKGQESFKELERKERVFLSKEDLLEMNQNWGLAFMLSKNIIDIVFRIKDNKDELQTHFEISQGYIPYRRSDLIKQFGELEGDKIVNERLWHSESKENEKYLPEIFGRELDKYGTINKIKKSFVKYGKHLAGFIDLKFFNQKRILVREITNPKIIASIITDIYVNDPQLISVIENGNALSLEFLWSILNSKLATFFHFNHSPKATKGAFPKILIQDIREFPLPKNVNIEPFERLVEYIIFLKSNKNILNHTDNDSISSHIESILDMMVYELYFKKHMKEQGLNVLEFIKTKPFNKETSPQQKSEIIKEFYEWFQEPENAVRQRMLLIETRSPDVLALINSSTI